MRFLDGVQEHGDYSSMLDRNNQHGSVTPHVLRKTGCLLTVCAVAVVRSAATRYDITPEQATGIFDMLDSQQQGRISKDDLFKHLFPLLQRMSGTGPPRKGSAARRKSSKVRFVCGEQTLPNRNLCSKCALFDRAFGLPL